MKRWCMDMWKVDLLEEVSEYYQNKGNFDELITLMETGIGLERAHMGIFTELGILYATYRPEKLVKHPLPLMFFCSIIGK